jgi:hypothetical protein
MRSGMDFVTHYTGRVVAYLAEPQGKHIRCKLQLVHPSNQHRNLGLCGGIADSRGAGSSTFSLESTAASLLQAQRITSGRAIQYDKGPEYNSGEIARSRKRLNKNMARDISAWQLGWEFIHDGKKSSRSTRLKRIGRGMCRRGRHGGHAHGKRIKLGRTRQPAAGNYRYRGETRKLPSNDPNQHVGVQWLSVAVRGNLEHNRTGSPRCFLS